MVKLTNHLERVRKMRWKLITAAAIAVLAVGPAIACGGPPVCTVVDPTGTPLNVRAKPAGKILANLRNGQEVVVIDHADVRGQRWAHVSKFEYMEPGWVFASYLKCGPKKGDEAPLCVVKDPTGTPLNIRAEAAGDIVGNVANGTRVRVFDRATHNGQGWVQVEKWDEDNTAGWVFDPYLKCEEDEEG
jgi:hypothetical protein